MPAQKKSASSLIGAVVGTLGFSALAGVLVAVMVAPAIAVTGMTANNSIGIFESLPNYITLGQQKQQNEIYLTDPAGVPQRIAVIFDQNRQEVPLAAMSPFLQQAAIAGEDRRFYEHGGVDLQSVLRAAVGQAAGSTESGGASTLTMQTVRNILVQEAVNKDGLTEAEKQKAYEDATGFSLSRKLSEMKLAISLEKQYSKAEILQGYLNIALFGRVTYGVEAAAQQYFSVPAAAVTPAQAAAIIAIVQNPSRLSLDNPEHYAANQSRRDKILGDMYGQKFLTKAQYDEAIAIPVDANFVKISEPKSGCKYADPNYSLFCDFIRKSVKDMPALGSTPEEREANFKTGGYKLYGTLNMVLQQVARSTVQSIVPANETRFQLGGATATVQPGTGRILAMAQNKDFDDGQDPAAIDPSKTSLNLTADVTHGGSKGFQPGSTYKAFTLLAFLDAGNGVGQTFNASKKTFDLSKFKDSCNGSGGGPYPVKNFSNEGGSYSVMRGTAWSVNTVFIQMASKLDQCAIRNMAASLGVHKAQDPSGELDTNVACVIGGCENNVSPLMMASAYAGIAASGNYCAPYPVDKVVKPDGTEVVVEPVCKQVIRPEVANTAIYALLGVVAGGSGAASRPTGAPWFGKTGTTDSGYQTWMVGSNTSAATAVWVGNIQGEQLLFKISVPAGPVNNLRHKVFKPIAQWINNNIGGAAFPGPSQDLIKGKPTFVPGLVGQTIAAAGPLVEEADLNLADGGPVDSDRPVGTIVRTDPPEGTSVSKGSTVTAFTSNGLGATVPDVSSAKNLSYNDARSALQAAGFSSISEGCTPGALPIDPDFQKVVAQDPAAGSVANKATPIKLNTHRVNC